MRRTSPILLVGALFVLTGILVGPALAKKVCRIDPIEGQLVCRESGVTPVQNPPERPPPEATPPPPDNPTRALRYVYTSFDAVIGDCYYWSSVPGGLDAWDPANDPAVIAITTKLPICPSTPTVVSDPVTSAWSIFRSWSLAAPAPSVTPERHGITGIPTHVSASPPASISHTETLPDGRVLEVRARAASLTIDWGDGTVSTYDPATASGYPTGATAHSYELKTCTQTYREEHPSGGLCDPTAAAYDITASYTWQGEFSVGSGWVALGSLDRAAPAISYDVDEARGVPVP